LHATCHGNMFVVTVCVVKASCGSSPQKEAGVEH